MREPAADLDGKRLVVGVVLLALAYVVTGRLGLEVAHYQSNATLVWPPTGIALAALVLFGRRLWPGVFLGALVANLSIPTPLVGALGIAIGNTMEALLGATLLVRVARFDPAFARTRDVLTFLAIGVFGCTLVSASMGTATLAATSALEGRDAARVWLIWWLGDAGGAVLVAPFLFVCARGRPRWSELAVRAESWIVLALVLASSVAAFGPWLAGHWLASVLASLPFPVLVWAGMRLGPRGAVSAAALTCGVAVVGTATHGGPFVGSSVHESLLLLWAYGAGLGASAAILAAAVAERDAAQAARLQAEQERRAIEIQMERAQRLETLGVLASGIAHDFNNIMTVVRANAELAAVDAPPEIAPALADIEEAAKRAGGLCRQLLEYAGGGVRRPELLRVDDLVHDVRRLLRGGIPKKIALRASVEPAYVVADAQQMHQVLMNLVINASEAIGEGEGTVEVRARLVDASAIDLSGAYVLPEIVPARWVALEVQDDGAGIDEATRRRVFEPFFTTKEHGRGLGLAALLGIVRGHGGALCLDSEPGRGTTFTALLPAADPIPAQGEEQDEPAPITSKTILVADDEPAVLEVTSEALRRAGFSVHAASDGHEALSVFSLREQEIDAVLLDLDMPGLDGREALGAIRARRHDMPAVMTSGLGEERARGDDVIFLAKPFDAAQVVRAVRRSIESAQARARAGGGDARVSPP